MKTQVFRVQITIDDGDNFLYSPRIAAGRLQFFTQHAVNAFTTCVAPKVDVVAEELPQLELALATGKPLQFGNDEAFEQWKARQA